MRVYLIPYLMSNLVALVVLAAAWRWPRVAQWTCVLVFAWAAVTNARAAISRPEVYVEYATLTPSIVYQDFITGWFSRHVRETVLPIAVAQLAIAALLAAPRPWRTLGVIGAVTFLLAIAPLGVGSAFPFSLTFGAAIVLMDRRRCAPPDRQDVQPDSRRVS